MIRTQVLKHLSGAGKGEREGRKRDVREKRLPEEPCRCIRVIDGEEVRGDDPLEYSSPVEVPQNEEVSGGGKNGRRIGVGSAI